MFLVARTQALLADEMGLGKTVQVAQALKLLRSDRTLRRALIVTPTSLVLNWQKELSFWGPDVLIRSTLGLDALDRRATYQLPIPIVVTSYDSLRRDFLVDPPTAIFDAVVFDEAQRLKNYVSDTAVASRRVEARRRWLLSATPLENGLDDVVSLLRATGFRGIGEGSSQPEVVEALQGRFLRRRKRDVLPQLPPIIDQTVTLELSQSQRMEYQQIEGALDAGSKSVPELLASINQLKQVCNRSSTGESSKLELLLTLLADAGRIGHRFIVVSQYVETLRWLEGELQGVAVTRMLTGADDPTARQAALDSFAGDPTPVVLLLSLKAGGVGLNIPTATHVVLFDRWWNPAAEDQAVHRAHRFGREEPLIAIRLLVEGTVEARIDEILSRKAQLFAEVIDQDSDGASVDSPRLSRGELLAVLRGSS